MKKEIKTSDIIIGFLLFFLWPFGIIPLALSKRIKHKVCVGFVSFAVFGLIGFAALSYIMLPLAAAVDGYGVSYGLTIANGFASRMFEYRSTYFGILIVFLAVYVYQIVKDRKNAKEVKDIEKGINLIADIDKRTTNQQELINIVSINNEETQKQYQKASLLTERERNFYETIRLIADKHNFNVLTKIRLADIVTVSDDIEYKSSAWYSEFNKISRKHIDFALADKHNLDIKLLIEIDDRTHQREDRIERDEFVDSVFKQANIPILHLYDVIGLEEKIINILHSEKTEQEM